MPRVTRIVSGETGAESRLNLRPRPLIGNPQARIFSPPGPNGAAPPVPEHCRVGQPCLLLNTCLSETILSHERAHPKLLPRDPGGAGRTSVSPLPHGSPLVICSQLSCLSCILSSPGRGCRVERQLNWNQQPRFSSLLSRCPRTRKFQKKLSR